MALSHGAAPPFCGIEPRSRRHYVGFSMIDVLLVDDHPVMRELLRQVLEVYQDLTQDLTIVAETEDGEEAVRQAAKFRPGVALIDIHLPTLSGIEVAKRIKLEGPRTAVIGLIAGEPDGSEKTMVSAGASAVLNKADVF